MRPRRMMPKPSPHPTQHTRNFPFAKSGVFIGLAAGLMHRSPFGAATRPAAKQRPVCSMSACRAHSAKIGKNPCSKGKAGRPHAHQCLSILRRVNRSPVRRRRFHGKPDAFRKADTRYPG